MTDTLESQQDFRPEARAPKGVLTGARHDVPRMLSAFDVFAMSSRTEGLPLALPEAMTATLPVVATAVGGVPGIVPKETGFLVPHGDPDALRAPIARLLEDAIVKVQPTEFSIDEQAGFGCETHGILAGLIRRFSAARIVAVPGRRACRFGLRGGY